MQRIERRIHPIGTAFVPYAPAFEQQFAHPDTENRRKIGRRRIGGRIGRRINIPVGIARRRHKSVNIGIDQLQLADGDLRGEQARQVQRHRKLFEPQQAVGPLRHVSAQRVGNPGKNAGDHLAVFQLQADVRKILEQRQPDSIEMHLCIEVFGRDTVHQRRQARRRQNQPDHPTQQDEQSGQRDGDNQQHLDQAPPPGLSGVSFFLIRISPPTQALRPVPAAGGTRNGHFRHR